MGKINLQKVVVGGLVAGVVLNVFDFLVYGVWLKNDMNAAMAALNKPAITSNMILWFVFLDFLYGIWLVWLYAAIRPRFGAGPKTAVTAGVAMWVLFGLLNTLAQAPMGLFPQRLMVIPVVVTLITWPIAAAAGAKFYTEMKRLRKEPKKHGGARWRPRCRARLRTPSLRLSRLGLEQRNRQRQEALVLRGALDLDIRRPAQASQVHPAVPLEQQRVLQFAQQHPLHAVRGDRREPDDGRESSRADADSVDVRRRRGRVPGRPSIVRFRPEEDQLLVADDGNRRGGAAVADPGVGRAQRGRTATDLAAPRRDLPQHTVVLRRVQ